MSEGSDDIQRLLERTATVLRRSRRYWRVYLVAVAAAVCAAFVAPVLIPPVYVSGAVLVHQELIASSKLMGQGEGVVETPRQRGARLREVLLARSNVERIIDALSLYPEIVASEGKSEAINQFLLDAEARVGDDTFTLKYRYRDPGLAQAAASLMAQSLVDQSVEYRREQARSTIEFVGAQRQTTKLELMSREEALAEFLAAHPEFALDTSAASGAATAGASIRAQNRKDLAADASQSNVGALQRQRQRLAARINAIDDPYAQAVVPLTPPSDPAMRRAVEQARRDVERATSELAEQRSRFTEVHPDVGRARGALAAAQATLSAAESAAAAQRGGQIGAGLAVPPLKESDRKELKARLDRIEGDLRKKPTRGGAPAEDDGAESSRVVDLETEWASLHRELRDVQERHGQLERRYFEASIIDSVEAAGGAAQMQIVDPAYRPERPTSRGPRRVGAVAAAVVLLVGCGVALLLASIDDRLYDREDLLKLELDGFDHVVPHDGRV